MRSLRSATSERSTPLACSGRLTASCAVSIPGRWWCWRISPSAAPPRAATGRSPWSTRPEYGAARPARTWIRLDLPVPDGPVMPSTSPRPMLSERSLTSMVSALRTATPSMTKRDLSSTARPLWAVVSGPQDDPAVVEIDGQKRSARVAGEDLRGQLDRPRAADDREALRCLGPQRRSPRSRSPASGEAPRIRPGHG